MTTKIDFDGIEHVMTLVDDAVDHSYISIVNGAVLTKEEIRTSTLKSSADLRKLDKRNPRLFADIFNNSFNRYRTRQVKVIAQADGTEHTMPELVTIATRHGTPDAPAYIYIGNPDYTDADHYSHLAIGRRNVARCQKRVDAADAFGKAHFGSTYADPHIVLSDND